MEPKQPKLAIHDQHTELTRILAEAKDQRACTLAVVKFEKFLNEDNYVSCWQVVLGNKHWLEIRGISIPENIYDLAENIGTKYYENSELAAKYTYENGRLLSIKTHP